MPGRPGVDDAEVASALTRGYALDVAELTFLPLGNDATAWSYRVRTTTGASWFVKLRAGPAKAAALAVPRYLADHGMSQVVAPVPGTTGGLFVPMGRYRLSLYPFVAGTSAMETGLSGPQRVEYGAFLRALHATNLPREVARLVRRERFVPAWAGTVRALGQRVRSLSHADGYDTRLAEIWRDREETIHHALRTAEELGRRLREQNPGLVVCHGDIHTANMLVHSGRISVVDWDETVLAPRERDLMFVGAPEEDPSPTSTESTFYEGYGPVTINPLAMAYYRYEWVVQEIGDYGKRIALDRACGEETRADAVRGLEHLFGPGDVVDAALRTPIG